MARASSSARRAGLTLTDAGRALLPRAERVDAEVAAERELLGADERVQGPVRITAGDRLVATAGALLGDLLRPHPELVVELRADTRSLDLSRREDDVAVRLGRPTEAALVAKKLGPVRFGLYAAADYLARNGTPGAAKGSPGIASSASTRASTRCRRWRGWPRPCPTSATPCAPAPPWPKVAACVAGHGVALLPTFVAPREPALVRVLPRLATPARDLYAVTHGDMRRHARVKLVVAWLAERVADQLAR
ncbi:MAG: LysR substrate-binding domain-containing protein [Myxococcota bacterium]